MSTGTVCHVAVLPDNFDIEKHLKIKEKMGIGLDLLDDDDIGRFSDLLSVGKQKLAEIILDKIRELFLQDERTDIIFLYGDPSYGQDLKTAIYLSVRQLIYELKLIVVSVDIPCCDGECILVIVREKYLKEWFKKRNMSL